ncbi:Putative cytochrome P450 [Colletotrichum destructivum]|uniref:Cytochrome P450 n=1 Tax=Colletotrichum destructivum TaxID=34406 RepID=A0AAX4J196_9PEZI|nr:Putative cytochrome P450 [Colletotrichum destructivum]
MSINGTANAGERHGLLSADWADWAELGAKPGTKYLLLALASWFLYRTLFFVKSRPMLPITMPLDIILTTVCVTAGGTPQKLRNLFRRYGGPLYGFTGKHQVIYDPSISGPLLTNGQPNHSLESRTVMWSLFMRVGGTGKKEGEALHTKWQASYKDLLLVLERTFLNEHGAANTLTAGNIPHRIANLVSYVDGSDKTALRGWERTADVKVIRPDTPEQPGIVELDLMNLLRDFGAHLAISLLFGEEWLAKYPECIEDLWKFEEQVLFLSLGLPRWIPLRSFQEGDFARNRITERVGDLFRRISDYQDGAIGGDDLSDVPAVSFGRSEVFRKHDVSHYHRAVIETSLLLGQNSNTQRATSWLIIFICCTPGLLEQLRDEVAPYVVVERDAATARHEIKTFDHVSIHNKCPLLKAAFYETFRLTNETASVRHVSKAVEVPMSTGEGPDKSSKTHTLPQGSWVTILHHLVQHDPAIFPDPKKFVPDRFLQTDPSTGAKVARPGCMKPWGIGSGMCRGRTYAEKQVLAIAAAFITLYEVQPEGGKEGVLTVPQGLPGTGTKVPKGGIRVRLRRREFE